MQHVNTLRAWLRYGGKLIGPTICNRKPDVSAICICHVRKFDAGKTYPFPHISHSPEAQIRVSIIARLWRRNNALDIVNRRKVRFVDIAPNGRPVR